MAHHGKNKKKKKVKKKRISKYAPGGMGSTYGQVEYGPNILEVPGADRNMQIYLDQNQRIFSNNLNRLEQAQEEYVNYLNQMNDAENRQNLSEGTARLLNKFRSTKGTNLKEKAKNLLKPTDASTFMESYNPGGEAFSGIAPKGTTAIQFADGSQASLLPGEVIPEGATALGTATPNALTQATANFATNTAVGSTAANIGSTITPYALPAYVVGEGIGYLADDDDPTTFTVGEAAGDVLSTAGKRTGQGALIGSIAGPPGQAIGAAVGATIGTIEGLYTGIRDRNEARDAEQEAIDERNTLYNEFLVNRRRDLAEMGPNRSLYGTRYMAKDGGIKPMNNQGDMVVYGPTHEQGGVMRDSNTELEGGGMKNGVALPGEVITNVKDSQGNTREYYFSDHLKNPSTGNTFAEDYRKSGGMNYNAKQMFAKLQEKVAGRNDKDRSPQTIAEDGGMGTMLPTMLPIMPSDTIQGISMDQNVAKLKFERNLQRQGINPFSPTVKQNTDVLKNSEGNFIYRYITPPTNDMRDGGMGERLDDISGQLAKASKLHAGQSKQLAKASKMHAGQSKKIGAMAKQLLKKAKQGGYKHGGTHDDDAPVATVNIPEVEVTDRRTRSELEKFLNLRGLQRELEFLNEGVLSRTPLKGETGAETAMNIASLTPLGMGRLGVLKTAKGLRDIATKTPKVVKEFFRKKKPFPQGTMDVPLPGGGVIKQPSLLPAPVKKNRSAKEILDNIRKFAKQNKSIIGRTATGLGVASGATALYTESEPTQSEKTLEELNKELLNVVQTGVTTERDTSDLSSAQNYIMKSLQRGEMNYPEVSNMKDSPLMLQSVIDSVKEAQGFEHGGFHPPTKPRDYRFNQAMPSRFDRSMEANMYRRQYDQYLKELEAYNAQMNTAPTVTDTVPTTTQPQLMVLEADKAEELKAAQAKTPEEIASMSDEELDAYLNATALSPTNVNLGEVEVRPDPQRMPMKPAQQITSLYGFDEYPFLSDPMAMQKRTMPTFTNTGPSKMDVFMRAQDDTDPNVNINKFVDPNTTVMADLKNELNIEDKEDKEDKKKKEEGEGFDLKGLLSKTGLDNIKTTDVLGVAAAGLGFAKANKLAKEMGDLELDIKGDIEVKNIPKQTVSLQSEKDKLQQDTNALVNEMTRQGKSTAEIAAIRSQGDEAMRKLGQTENNLQAQMDLKTDALNATNDFKKNAANKNVELSKALADLDISAAEKRNRMNIWNKLTNEVIGMGLDRAKLKSVEKQMDTLAESIASGNEAMMKTLMEEIKKLIKG